MESSLIEQVFFKRRSIRRFKNKPILMEDLRKCIDCARLCPTGKNLQPLEYIIITEQQLREKIFGFLHWAGYLPSFTPSVEQQPMAYVAVLVNKKISEPYLVAYDVGIAMAHIVLFAETKNIGSCMLKNIDRKKIQKLLRVPESHFVDSIIALGYKDERPYVEIDDDKKKYWLDDKKRLHVPKKPLSSVLHEQTYP
jgi:nitroreductase